MEPLDQLHAKIRDFPGYGTYIERRRSDEYVRSYLGEALTALAARCKLTPQLQQRIDSLVLRVAFADPRCFPVHDPLGAQSGSNDGAVATADAATVALADRAATVDEASASSYLDDATVMLDRRDAALRAALTAP
jgi:hypothetical protein